MNLSDKFKNSDNIAVVRTDRIGDMVLTLPLIRALKEYQPRFNVSVIAASYTEELLKNDYTDNYFFVDKHEGGINGIFRENNFDAVFFPMPKFNESAAGYLSKIPIRIGTAFRAYSFFFNHRIHDHRKISEYHEAEYNLRMAESICGMKFTLKAVQPSSEPELLLKMKTLTNELKECNSNKLIVFHPSSRASSKDLPVSTLINTIKALSSISNIKICITGSKDDSELCKHIESSCKGIINLCGRFDLAEMIAFIKNIDLLLANSTGILHIASVCEIPVIGFYPNTAHISAKRWGPIGKNKTIITPDNTVNSMKDDMSDIKVETIIRAISSFIG